jgi:hypothetical protein
MDHLRIGPLSQITAPRPKVTAIKVFYDALRPDKRFVDGCQDGARNIKLKALSAPKRLGRSLAGFQNEKSAAAVHPGLQRFCDGRSHQMHIICGGNPNCKLGRSDSSMWRTLCGERPAAIELTAIGVGVPTVSRLDRVKARRKSRDQIADAFFRPLYGARRRGRLTRLENGLRCCFTLQPHVTRAEVLDADFRATVTYIGCGKEMQAWRRPQPHTQAIKI